MVTLTEPLIFQHCPLADARTHFRLLKVLSVVEGRPIPVHCELTAFSIADAPPYHAISYTWGNPAPLALILINGRQMHVRLNCEYALRQTHQINGDGIGDFLIWIDSICINQLDKAERGSQVSMMGDIFKTATKVLACVGAHEDDSEFLYEFLSGEEAKFQSILSSDASITWETSFFYDFKLSRRKLASWRWRYPRSVRIRLCKSLAKFLARSYFHRVWVYQELFLGRDISVYCGDQRLPISWIWLTNSIIQSWLWTLTDYFLFFGISRYGLWSTLWSKTREAMPLLLAGATEQPLMPFNETATAVTALSCQDPRDRVYGILSIIAAVESRQLQPDYTKDRFDLAIEVLQATRAGNSRDIISLASYAQTVGLNLKLKGIPSQKLIAAIELRLLSTNLQERVLNATGRRNEMSDTAYLPFVGFRIILRLNEWGFESQDRWSMRHGPTLIPPKSLQSDKVPNASVGIYLPPEAQDGDWLLIPRSYNWVGEIQYSGSKFAFLARDSHPEKFEIVGKALISFKRKVSNWDKTFKKGGSSFKVFCDLEDLLVLFHLCNWEALWRIRKSWDSESVDAYFETNFCGGKYSSYAVRMET